AVVEADAGGALGDLLPAAAAGVWAAVAVAADREIDDPGALLREVLGAQPVPVHDAGTVALAEHVDVADKLADRGELLRLVEVEEAAALAVARVHDVLGHLRQVARRHHQHVGAVFRERARGDWAGEDARQVEHADARQGTVAPGEGNRVALTD